MFLDLLARRNPALLQTAMELHQKGQLPANSYVLDLDAIGANAGAIGTEAQRLGLTVFAMTKQLGRNPDVSRALIAAGIPDAVAVDMACARATTAAGMALGHIGHLVQVPTAEARAAASLDPANWTVFSLEKAREAAAAARSLSRDQRLLARLFDDGDEFYSGHEGGFPAAEIMRVADALDALDGAHFGGITTFPALIFDAPTQRVRTTANLRTLERAAELLRTSGRSGFAINAPGTTSTVTLAALADAGATQVEPGHALTGTTPLHAARDLQETPAVCYLSEVSHLYDGRAYCFGGGTYVDPVFAPYQVTALVGRELSTASRLNATLPPPAAIDYYGQLHPEKNQAVSVGDSVVFGFRVQAFVTRAYTAAVSGIASGTPQVEGIWSSDGSATSWPN